MLATRLRGEECKVGHEPGVLPRWDPSHPDWQTDYVDLIPLPSPCLKIREGAI